MGLVLEACLKQPTNPATFYRLYANCLPCYQPILINSVYWIAYASSESRRLSSHGGKLFRVSVARIFMGLWLRPDCGARHLFFLKGIDVHNTISLGH